MANSDTVRIRVPAPIRPGEIIRVRILVIHPMELVQRDEQGRIVEKPYNFVHVMVVKYNGKEIMRAETTQAISQNPMFTFPLKVDHPGKLTVAVFDTAGRTYEADAEITFG
jgi:thiosulfate oxidation carrier complex protein SoxZ